MLALGWTLGFAVAAPHVWPLLDYGKTGARMGRRQAGMVERPPVGISALPQAVLPDLYGSSQTRSLWLAPNNQFESPAAGYAGLVAVLLVAPLAWFSRRHRWFVWCWTALGCFGLSWCLNVPGVVSVLQLPVLKIMSHNRLVFVTAFAIIALAAIGFDQLCQGAVVWRRWCWAPVTILAMLLGWSVYRMLVLPEPVATQVAKALAEGKPLAWFGNVEAIRDLQAWFVRSYATGAGLCLLGLAGWGAMRFRQSWPVSALAALMGCVVGDLLLFAWGRNPQCDPALYYPRLPMLEYFAKSEPGRILGYQCLPPALAQTHGLNDLRGYDSVDPAGLIDLLERVAAPTSVALPWAWTQLYAPPLQLANGAELKLPPVLDMLDVRYLVFRGAAPPQITPHVKSPDYWALINRNALGRVFIPERVEYIPDREKRLQKICSGSFVPRAVGVIEEPIILAAPAKGVARIVSETPTRVTISAKMETAGLLVLGDAWDRGWRAHFNGATAPVLRVNHYLRGVLLPAGATTVEFLYQPRNVMAAFALCGVAVLGLATWVGWVRWRQGMRNESGAGSQEPAAASGT